MPAVIIVGTSLFISLASLIIKVHSLTLSSFIQFIHSCSFCCRAVSSIECCYTFLRCCHKVCTPHSHPANLDACSSHIPRRPTPFRRPSFTPRQLPMRRRRRLALLAFGASRAPSWSWLTSTNHRISCSFSTERCRAMQCRAVAMLGQHINHHLKSRCTTCSRRIVRMSGSPIPRLDCSSTACTVLHPDIWHIHLYCLAHDIKTGIVLQLVEHPAV